jgi:hypothetical protein
MLTINKTNSARWMAGAALLIASLSGVAALRAASAAPTSVPVSLTEQGRILDPTGAVVAGKLAVKFTIYDDPAASAAKDALWTETQNLQLNDGYFSAQLGAAAANPFPAGTFDGSVRYLGVTAGSDAEMTPRQAITSVPYALQASHAFTSDSAATAVTATTALTAASTPMVTAWTKDPTPIVRLYGGAAGTALTGQTTTQLYRRVGDSIEVMAETSLTVVPASNTAFLWELPNGLTIDANKLPAGYSPTGTGEVVNSTGYYVGAADIDPGAGGILIDMTGSAHQSVSAEYPVTLTTGSSISIHYTAPVTGWGVTQ